MSTRGLFGIRKQGIDKATYNHCDSYPDGLGRDFINFIKSLSIEELNSFFDNIELVNSNSEPTEEQKKIAVDAGYCDITVSNNTQDDWYCLLRNLQGNFEEYAKVIHRHKRIYMTDDIEFIKDSLFCEYAYIFNLDTEMLEFFVGFQKNPDMLNRYGQKSDNGYYPCKMVLQISYSDILNKDTEEIVKEIKKAKES